MTLETGKGGPNNQPQSNTFEQKLPINHLNTPERQMHEPNQAEIEATRELREKLSGMQLGSAPESTQHNLPEVPMKFVEMPKINATAGAADSGADTSGAADSGDPMARQQPGTNGRLTEAQQFNYGPPAEPGFMQKLAKNRLAQGVAAAITALGGGFGVYKAFIEKPVVGEHQVAPTQTATTVGLVETTAPRTTVPAISTEAPVATTTAPVSTTAVETATPQPTPKTPDATTAAPTTAAATEVVKPTQTPEGKKLIDMQVYEQAEARKIVTDSKTVTVAGVQIEVSTGFVGDLDSTKTKVLKSNEQLQVGIGIDVNNIKFGGSFANNDKTKAIENTLGLFFYLNNAAYNASQKPSNERPPSTLVDGFNKKADVGGTKIIEKINKTLTPDTPLKFGSQQTNRTAVPAITLSQVESVSFMFTDSTENGVAVSPGIAGSGVQNLVGITESKSNPGKFNILISIAMTKAQIEKGNSSWNLTNDLEAKKQIPGLEASLNFATPILDAYADAKLQQPKDTSFQNGVDLYNEVSKNGYSEAAIPSSKPGITLSEVEQFNTFDIPYTG